MPFKIYVKVTAVSRTNYSKWMSPNTFLVPESNLLDYLIVFGSMDVNIPPALN